MRKSVLPRTLLALAIFGLALLARADRNHLDFDRNGDVQDTIDRLGKQARIIRIQASSILVTAQSNPLKGHILGFNPISRVENSSTYNDALRYPPLLDQLPEEPRGRLTADWAGIESARTTLLDEAAGLERKDNELARRGDELNRNAERLSKRRAELVDEVDRFNRACTGRPLPPDQHDECVRWQNDLLKRIESHNAEVNTHNQRFLQWQNDVKELRARAGTSSGKNATTAFLPRVIAWEHQKIKPFISSAEAALSGLGPTRVVMQAQGKLPPVQKSVSVITQDPLCKEAGHQLLAQLWEKLAPAERAERNEALISAKAWIDSRPPRGVTAPPPVRMTFQNANRRDPSARIDIDVWAGTAFVTCTCCAKHAE